MAYSQRNASKLLTEKNGKIGIGTEHPDQLLTVKGTIHTQEVLVDLNGAVAPDYVFEAYFNSPNNSKPDYVLLSLEEVAAYVKQFNHLPGVPSAKQLKEEGLSLKEMNLLLLEKIEELTLYTLEQQAEINLLKEKVSSLDN